MAPAAPATAGTPPLVVIGSGAAGYREFAFAAMAATAPIVLVDTQLPTWQRRYVSDVHLIERFSLDHLLAAVRGYADSHRIGGVVTLDERYVEPVAQLVAELGLPGASPDAVRACKDKWTTRRRLAATGAGAVQAELAHTLDEAVAAADRIGLPVVLKPRAFGGSIGVVRADTLAEVASGYGIAAVGAAPGLVLTHESTGVIVEEYVPGEEYSVDSVVYEGRVTPICLAHKELGPAPYFQEIGHVVDPTVPIPDALVALLQRVHELLGFDLGVTHTEVKLAPDGYRLIEVNARLGGDLIPYLGRLALGADLAGAVADLALGRPPRVTVTPRQAAAVRFVLPPHDLVIDEVRIPADWPEVDGVESARPLVRPGVELRLPPGDFMSRAAVVVTVGATGKDCLASLDAAVPRIAIMGRPLA